MLIIWAIGATIALIAAFIWQAALFITIVLLIVIASSTILGLEAIILWQRGQPYEMFWFIMGWLAVGFWLFVCYKCIRKLACKFTHNP